MSHLSKIFEEAPTRVPNVNGFDLSHLRSGSSKTGQLVPCMCKLLPPKSKFTLGVAMEVSLPPLATSFFGRIDAIIEGFVVPVSILYGGWKQFISNNEIAQYPLSQQAVQAAGGYKIPYWNLNYIAQDHEQLEPVSQEFYNTYDTHDNLYEFLGMKKPQLGLDYDGGNVSLLPALAYHRICDVFYRNSKITRTWFAVNPGSGNVVHNVSTIWHSYYTDSDRSFSTLDELSFPDGTPVFCTRQRNYARDYFTSAVPTPQQGETPAYVRVNEGEESELEFSIPALRMANALQRFRETNNLSGAYDDIIRNRWGANPIDADFDEPYYLGRLVVPVYNKSVFQQGTYGDSVRPSNRNPFTSILGGRAASGSFSGNGSICKSFNVTCWSYVMCIFSLVPHATYSSGINKELQYLELGDFPSPEFQGVGYEEIKNKELSFSDDDNDGTFGYIPRYSSFKYMDDEVVGELAAGNSLEAFQLQRRFTLGAPELSTEFLQIPQNALDSVMSVATGFMNLSCWYEIFFEFKVSMPLSDFVIPTLSDLQDTHVQKAAVGGSKL